MKKTRRLMMALIPLAAAALPAAAAERIHRLPMIDEATFYQRLDKLVKDAADLGGYVITRNDDGSYTVALQEPKQQSACNNNPPVATLHKPAEPPERLDHGMALLKARNEALAGGKPLRLVLDNTRNACVRKGKGAD